MKIEGDPDEIKRNSVRGAYYVYSRGGQTILAAWPRERKGKMSERQQFSVDKFTQAAAATKYMDATDQNLSRVLTKRTNALPRDLLMQALYARLGDFFLMDGTRVYSVASEYDLTDLLDVLSSTPGAVIYRGSDYWAALAPGTSGQTLKMGVDGFPVWVSEAGGGGSFALVEQHSAVSIDPYTPITITGLDPTKYDYQLRVALTRDPGGASVDYLKLAFGDDADPPSMYTETIFSSVTGADAGYLSAAGGVQKIAQARNADVITILSSTAIMMQGASPFACNFTSDGSFWENQVRADLTAPTAINSMQISVDADTWSCDWSLFSIQKTA